MKYSLAPPCRVGLSLVAVLAIASTFAHWSANAQVFGNQVSAKVQATTTAKKKKKKQAPAIGENCFAILCTGVYATPRSVPRGAKTVLSADMQTTLSGELKYDWKADAGVLEQHGASATVDTTGVSPGTYHVRLTISGEGHSSECSGSFEVE